MTILGMQCESATADSPLHDALHSALLLSQVFLASSPPARAIDVTRPKAAASARNAFTILMGDLQGLRKLGTDIRPLPGTPGWAADLMFFVNRRNHYRPPAWLAARFVACHCNVLRRLEHSRNPRPR